MRIVKELAIINIGSLGLFMHIYYNIEIIEIGAGCHHCKVWEKATTNNTIPLMAPEFQFFLLLNYNLLKSLSWLTFKIIS